MTRMPVITRVRAGNHPGSWFCADGWGEHMHERLLNTSQRTNMFVLDQ